MPISKRKANPAVLSGYYARLGSSAAATQMQNRVAARAESREAKMATRKSAMQSAMVSGGLCKSVQ